MELIFPTAKLKEAVMAYRQGFFDHGEMKIPGSAGLGKVTDYETWLTEKIKAQTEANEGWVPHSIYFAVVNGKIVGNINIRHELNDALRFDGGHIGYAVHPTERCKGYATKMLALALNKCREPELKLNKAMVCTAQINIASQKTITNNGGILESKYVNENGTECLRYWIEL